MGYSIKDCIDKLECPLNFRGTYIVAICVFVFNLLVVPKITLYLASLLTSIEIALALSALFCIIPIISFVIVQAAKKDKTWAVSFYKYLMSQE